MSWSESHRLIASCIVIAFSACWLTNLALACILGTGYGGIIIGPGVKFIIGSDVCVRTLVDVQIVPAVPLFGEITSCMSLFIAGTAPGVLCLDFLWCVRFALLKFLFAVGSLVFIIGGAVVILVIGCPKGDISGGAAMQFVPTLHLLPTSAVSKSSMARFNLWMNVRPLCIFATIAIVVVSSLVSTFKCAVLLRFGTWQCCGNKSADPDTQYARVSGT